MRKTADSNLPPAHLLEALRASSLLQRYRLWKLRGAQAPGPDASWFPDGEETVLDEVELPAEFIPHQGSGAPPPQVLDALRSCEPGFLRTRKEQARGPASRHDRANPAHRKPRLGDTGRPNFRSIPSTPRPYLEELSDDAVAEIAAEHGVAPEEIRANPRAYIWDSRDSYISFELPRVRPPKAADEPAVRSERMDRLVRPGATKARQEMTLAEKKAAQQLRLHEERRPGAGKPTLGHPLRPSPWYILHLRETGGSDKEG